jgi:hypothetical protein
VQHEELKPVLDGRELAKGYLPFSLLMTNYRDQGLSVRSNCCMRHTLVVQAEVFWSMRDEFHHQYQHYINIT